MEWFQEKYKNHKDLFNMFFAFTFAILTFIIALSNLYIENFTLGVFIVILFSVIVSVFVSYFIFSKTRVIEDTRYAKTSYKVISLILLVPFLNLMMSYVLYDLMNINIIIEVGIFNGEAFMSEVTFGKVATLIQAITSLLIIPVSYLGILYLVNRFLPKVINFFKTLNDDEKKYLKIFNIALGTVAIVVFFITNIFTCQYLKEEDRYYSDVLFTADSGDLIRTDPYRNIQSAENDLRQPLFGLANLPFGLIAEIVQKIFDFIPGRMVYGLAIELLQIFVLSVTAILISRLVCKDKKQTNFLICYSVMFSTIVFALTIEQYVFAIFWLILVIYNSLQYKKSDAVTYSFATGSLLTSGIVLPFILDIKDFKKYVMNGFKYLVIFLLLIIVCGNFYKVYYNVMTFGNENSIFTKFMGKEITMKDKVVQFTHMIKNCFVSPRMQTALNVWDVKSIQLVDEESCSIIGIILLVLMVISFIVNHKKKIVKVSFGWLIFSMIITVVIGWGTQENGLILYSLYFGWAYFILLYELLENILDRMKVKESGKDLIYTELAVILLILNIPWIYTIIDFGVKNYPSIFTYF